MTYRCSKDMTLLNEKSSTVDYGWCLSAVSWIEKCSVTRSRVVYLPKFYKATSVNKYRTMYIIPCGFFGGGRGLIVVASIKIHIHVTP